MTDTYGIERASTADRAFLAMEGGGHAEQIGVALVLGRARARSTSRR